MNCPEPTKWQRWLDDDLGVRLSAIFHKHLGDCDACRRVVEDLRSIDEMVEFACRPPIDIQRLKRRVMEEIDPDHPPEL